MTGNRRLKTAAAAVPQSREEADALLGEIGQLSRRIETLEAKQTESIARIKAETKAQTGPLADERREKFKALTAWAEANRDTLLKGKARSVKLSQGVIGWRWGNPTVKVKRGLEDTVIERIRRSRSRSAFQRLVRVRHELDRDAIARDPKSIESIEDISVEQAECFWAKPLDVKCEEKKDLRKVSGEAVVDGAGAEEAA